MIYPFLADGIVMVHVAFVIFVLFGGFLVLYRRRWMWLHIPAAAWAVFVEMMGWICPLTPLENHLRSKGGHMTYETDFIEYYVMPILYPGALTRRHQVLLGIFVMMINLSIYAWAFYRQK
jgi:hypothetical protein